jgi:carbon monoxide dehydrogenase subunit G
VKAAIFPLLFVLAAGSPAASETVGKPQNIDAEAKRDPVVWPRRAKDGTRGLEAHFVVAAPAEKVLATLWDVRAFTRIFPDVKKLTVVDEGDGWVEVECEVRAVVKTVRYRLHRTLDRKAGIIRWRRTGGDLKKIEGAWHVGSHVDPRFSRVQYHSYVDVGYGVPSRMVRHFAIKKVNEMAGRVRAAMVEKAPTP